MKCRRCAGTGSISVQQSGVGVVIQTARMAIGLTQEDLAERSGLSRYRIANIEVSRSQLPTYAIRKVAAALNMDPMELVP